MKKKLAILLAGTLIGTSLLTGCGTGDKPTATTEEKTDGSVTGEKVTVRMAYWNNEETVQELIDYIEAQLPNVEIEYQFIDNSNYHSIIDTQLAAGEGPDIICESVGSALKHAKVGYTADLSKYADLFSDAGKSVYTHNDKLYALPGISWFEGIYYNVELFQENNISLPTTFDEYIAVCEKFKELGIKPLAAGLKSWEPMLKSSMAFVTAEYLSTEEGKSFGEDYRLGKTTLNGTWNKYIEKWSEMITKGIYTTEMSGIDTDQALDEFAMGKAAMFCSGPWHLETIKEKNPKLVFDMMPFYGTQKSEGWLIGGPGCGFAVNEKSKNKDVVMQVMDVIATKEGQEALWKNNQGGSSYLVGTAFDMPKEYTSVMNTLSAGNVYCPWDEWGAAGPAHEDYGKEMQNYLLGGQDIATTLGNIDMKVQELLSK